MSIMLLTVILLKYGWLMLLHCNNTVASRTLCEGMFQFNLLADLLDCSLLDSSNTAAVWAILLN